MALRVVLPAEQQSDSPQVSVADPCPSSSLPPDRSTSDLGLTDLDRDDRSRFSLTLFDIAS